MDAPDPKQHRNISFIKSGLRLFGCALFLVGLARLGILFFAAAEGLGIWEEMV